MTGKRLELMQGGFVEELVLNVTMIWEEMGFWDGCGLELEYIARIEVGTGREL